MPAPPLLGILDLGQNKKRLERFEHGVMRQSDRRAGADDESIKIAYARFLLRRDPARVARSRIGHELGFEAEFLSYGDLHFFAQPGRRRDRDDDFAFFFCRFEDFIPFRGLFGFRGEQQRMTEERDGEEDNRFEERFGHADLPFRLCLNRVHLPALLTT